jgi:O6-methylguanine-DNA--protein-cysteine methyltransferase
VSIKKEDFYHKIGSNHSLTGFAGGLDAKRKLLELEAE